MCAIFLERFVFPDFCTFRFSNRAHFVLPDSDNLWDLQYLSNEFSKLSQEKKDYSKKIFMEMAACDGYVDPREVSIINKL